MPLKAQEIPDYLRDQIIEIQNQMLIEGFEVTSIGRTWLGRILIKASNGSVEREIVINRGSGQVIHDRKKKPRINATKNYNTSQKNVPQSPPNKKHADERTGSKENKAKKPNKQKNKVNKNPKVKKKLRNQYQNCSR